MTCFAVVSSLAVAEPDSRPPRWDVLGASLGNGLFVMVAIVRGSRGVKGERNFPLAKYTCVKPGYCLLSQRNHGRPWGRTRPPVTSNRSHRPRTLFAI